MGLYAISVRRSIGKQRLTLFGLASFSRICIVLGSVPSISISQWLKLCQWIFRSSKIGSQVSRWLDIYGCDGICGGQPAAASLRLDQSWTWHIQEELIGPTTDTHKA